MAKTYAEFRDLVRSWANRDEEVLPNDRVQDFMQYAADRAYRTLRVPPLETTVRYNDADSLEAATTNANIIYCLLYTSPSPRDRQKSRMPSSA